ncbi:MAG: ribosome small subunit-dependent GTPase A [Calditrichia bacterium]
MNTFKKPHGMRTEHWKRAQKEIRFQKDLARVIVVNRDSYVIRTGEMEIYAEIPGNIRYAAQSPLDLPVVGDWVEIEKLNGGDFAIILNILSRFTLIKRKYSGKKVEFQPIAANVDVAFVMQSGDGNFNMRRLERYLSMISEAGCMPAFILSKSDLAGANELQRMKREFETLYPNIPFFEISLKTGQRLTVLEEFLREEFTYCFLGSSGVGKTSLINYLLGAEKFKTSEVRSKDHRGRHTTSKRQLIQLSSGAFIIDTPGMRELGNFQMDTGLSSAFSEIEKLAAECQFSDCKHQTEKGCSVLKALREGRISKERYLAYQKLLRESAHYEMSYYQKRKKEKGFTKMVREVKKIKPMK